VSRLDRAIDGLHIDGLATLVMARIEQAGDDAAQGLRTLRWTNAGHPPPILLHADGTTDVLETVPEMLVGVMPGTERSDHTHVLPPGSTLLLYTDGLIEHPGRDLDDGITDLRRALTASGDRTLEELLDHLVAELVGDSPDDDCAILAVRAHPPERVAAFMRAKNTKARVVGAPSRRRLQPIPPSATGASTSQRAARRTAGTATWPGR
jgi:hypothetical protein